MKTLNVAAVLLALLCMIGSGACSRWNNGSEDGPDRIYPLTFDQDSLEIRQEFTTRLSPLSSNGSNTLDVSPGDTSMLKVNVMIFENGTSHASGWIALTGCRKGHTSLTVYDRIARETAVLHVRITDFYLGMRFMSGNHPFFSAQRPGFLFLVDNDARDYYYFAIKDGQPDAIIGQGAYAFSVSNNTPYLTLTPASGAACCFNLSQNDARVYTLFRHFFHFDWAPGIVAAANTKVGDMAVDGITGNAGIAATAANARLAPAAATKDIDRSIHLYMHDDATGKEVFFVISEMAMPAGILKE